MTSTINSDDRQYSFVENDMAKKKRPNNTNFQHCIFTLCKKFWVFFLRGSLLVNFHDLNVSGFGEFFESASRKDWCERKFDDD